MFHTLLMIRGVKKKNIHLKRDVRLLRDTHHIVGALTGSLPRAPRQNNQLGLPLKLMPEEAFALITYGVAKLMRLNLPYHSQHDITTFQEARKESFEKQKSIYLEQMQAKENIYRNSKQSQLSKKKKRKQKQMKKYEKEKLETLQAAETVPENPDGRVGGAKTCDWEVGARDDSKVKDMNVAHRDWFPIVEKSSSKDATDQCILGDSSQAREGLDEMDIDGNSKLWSDRKGPSTNPNQSTSHLITYSGDEDTPTGVDDKLEAERPLSLNNVRELPASLETTSLQQLPPLVNEDTNMDTSQGSSSLTSNCSRLGMKDGVSATLPYMSPSTSSTSNTNIPPIDLNLIDSRLGKETTEATTCFSIHINVTTYHSTKEQTMPNPCTGNCPPNLDEVSKVTDSRPGETNTVIEKETKLLKLKQTDGESHVMESTLEGINAATERINAATEGINAATEGIKATTEEIKTNTEEIKTTTEIKATTEEVKATTEEIKTTTEKIKTTTEEINVTTEEIKTTTEGIKATTEGIKATTEEINATTEEIKATTEEIKATTEEIEDQMADGMVDPSPKQLIKPEENKQGCEEADQSSSPMDLPMTQAGCTVTDNGCLIQLFTETVNPDMTEVNDWSFPSTDQERIRAAVFLHFWEQGYYLTSGMKFGGDFLIYKGDPLLYHSTFIAVCLPYQKSMSTQMIISYGRLGPIVKKTVLLCSLDDQGNVRSVSLQWSGI
ncbi:uncharacterized protein [Apostichopus japonicus]|uniref:uncharacterized protein isoform X2 n=1 Tax=Stichopus japonicus TaxID=307972 RepID=UPI003AB22BF3